ncbi:MAG TPA: phosphatidylserine decarboxylase [Puia sp.]
MKDFAMNLTRLICLFIIINCSGFAYGQNDCAPVEKLKSMYAGNQQFRQVIEDMFTNVQNLPDGSANFWKNRNINDLYKFLNEWFYELPTTNNGLDRIVEFSLLYYHNPYGLKFVQKELGLSWTIFFVEEHGKFMDSKKSIASISEWLADSSLDNSDYQVPSDGFQSFNQFFARNLKPGTRPISRPQDNSVIVSPVDGVINWINNDLKLDSTMPIKGRMSLSLNQLLGHSPLASKFIGGTAVSIILLPENYHHYHSPVTGRLVESKDDVGNELFGSQILDVVGKGNIGYNADFSIYENFKHGYFIIMTKNYGYVALVPVGLETIGSVVFEDRVKNISPANEVLITKGEKLGYFAYGGSLVMLLFEKNRLNKLSVLQGQEIGKLSK